MNDHEFMDALLSGEMTPEQAGAWERQAAARPELLEMYERQLHIHQALKVVLQDDFANRRIMQSVKTALQDEPHADRIMNDLRARQTPGVSKKNLFIRLAAAAAVVLGVYGVNVWQARQSEKAVLGYVRETRGQVQAAAAVIHPGDSIQTGPDGYLKFAYPDGSEIELSKNTQMTLGASRKSRLFGLVQSCAKKIQLDVGRLTAQVAKQNPGQAMVLTTPHAQVTVVGTKFSLSTQADETRLTVTEGLVQMRTAVENEPIMVSAGQCAVAASAQKLAAFSGVSPTIAPVQTVGPPVMLPPDQAENPILLSLDFEDGLTPVEWTGKIVTGPERPNNLYCLAGVYNPRDQITRVVVAAPVNLFTYREGAMLTFDYWVDQTPALDIYAWDNSQSASMGQPPMWAPKTGMWARATVSLAMLQEAGTGKRIRDGDVIGSLSIQTSPKSGGVLYVDNVEVALPGAK